MKPLYSVQSIDISTSSNSIPCSHQYDIYEVDIYICTDIIERLYLHNIYTKICKPGFNWSQNLRDAIRNDVYDCIPDKGTVIWNRAFWVRKTPWIWKYVMRCLEGTIGMGEMLFLGNISLQYRDWKIPPLMRKVWCSNPSRDRPEVAKKGSDNSTAKRSATGVRVRGPCRWPLSTDAVCHSRCARLKTIVLSLIAKIQWNNHLQNILCKLIIP